MVLRFGTLVCGLVEFVRVLLGLVIRLGRVGFCPVGLGGVR